MFAPTAAGCIPTRSGLTMATFRQTTSRADDPQIHTHAVISAKVQTADGRWLALDARFLKRHQRTLGGLYQSVLRNELTHHFGFAWTELANAQAEVVGVPEELLTAFSKRTGAIDTALKAKLDEFRSRQGREPTRWERAAMTREASADTRSAKSGHGAPDLRARWIDEAAQLGWTPTSVVAAVETAGQERSAEPVPTLTASGVIDALSTAGIDVDASRRPARRSATPNARVPQLDGQRWAVALEQLCDQVIEQCVQLDPEDAERAPAELRWPLDVARANRAAPHQRDRARRGRTRAHLGDRRPDRRPAAVVDGRRRRPRRASGQRRRSRRRTRPARADRRAGRRRQDQRAAQRRRRPRRAAATGVRRRPVREGRTGSPARRRTARRHRRQAAPRMGTRRPAAAAATTSCRPARPSSSTKPE